MTPWSVAAEEYGYFLSKIWDEWQARDVGKVLVNLCETLVAQHMGLPSQVCVHSEICGKGVALNTTATCTAATTTSTRSTGSATFASSPSATWCSRRAK